MGTEEKRTGTPSWGPTTLLILETDGEIGALVEDRLSPFKFSILQARSPDEVRGVASGTFPDIAIIGQPASSAGVILWGEKLLAQAAGREMSLLLACQEMDPDLRKKCFATGFYELLVKPLNISEVVELLLFHREMLFWQKTLRTHGVQVRIKRQEEGWLVSLHGALTIELFPAIGQALSVFLRRGELSCCLDLDGITEIDSAGLGALFNFWAQGRQSRRSLKIIANSREVREALELAKLDRVILGEGEEVGSLGELRITRDLRETE